MKRHYFLGTATGFSRKMRILMRKTKGHQEDLVELQQYLVDEYDGRQALLLTNGRSAIAGILENYKDFKWSGKKEQGEVIINGFTCHAVVQGVREAGFMPVYADIDKATLNFTVKSLEKVVTPRTRAVIVQNTLGNMVDIGSVEKFCKKHGLVLIEDLAHCVGRFYPDGREAGKVGEAVAFSFGKEKSIDTCGGGAVVFRNMKTPLMSEPCDEPSDRQEFRARIYPTIGLIYRKLSYVGLNGIFMRLMLKMGIVKKSADGEVDFRRVALCEFQAKIALLQFKEKEKLKERPLREFAYVKDRDDVLVKLRKAGYYFDGFWYEKPVSPERYYKKADFPEKECPNAVWVAKHILNLPVYYKENELESARKIIKESEVEVKDE